MSEAIREFREVLEADARRRVQQSSRVGGSAAEQAGQTVAFELRFRLMNTFPRQVRPLFGAVQAALSPYGYALSPLHPVMEARRPSLQTELTRLAPEDAQRFAPLLFELDGDAPVARVFVRQVGGRPAPEFGERRFELTDTIDLPALTAILHDYVACMVQTLLAAAPAA